MNRISKAAIILSSLTIAGALIAYEGGYIPVSLPGYARAPQTSAPAQPTTAQSAPFMLFSDSKYKTITPVPPASAASASSPAVSPGVLIQSSKSFNVTVPEQTGLPEAYLPAPATAAAPVAAPATGPAILIGGSKVRVPIVEVPPTQPASRPASGPATREAGK